MPPLCPYVELLLHASANGGKNHGGCSSRTQGHSTAAPSANHSNDCALDVSCISPSPRVMQQGVKTLPNNNRFIILKWFPPFATFSMRSIGSIRLVSLRIPNREIERS